MIFLPHIINYVDWNDSSTVTTIEYAVENGKTRQDKETATVIQVSQPIIHRYFSTSSVLDVYRLPFCRKLNNYLQVKQFTSVETVLNKFIDYCLMEGMNFKQNGRSLLIA